MKNLRSQAITLYHNPACGTSRQVLGMLEQMGHAPRIVEYLRSPLSAHELAGLANRGGLTARQLLREKECLYRELDLGHARWSDEELFDVLAAHPVLLNRPIVETAGAARVCRPAETVLELLA